MTPVRVVLDSNIFDVETFDALERSPLQQLVRKGRVAPVYGHVVLEELMRAYESPNKRKFLSERWLPFIIATCDSICNDFNTIYHQELVCGLGPNAKRLMRQKDFDRLKARLMRIPTDGSWGAWHATKGERDLEDRKRSSQHKLAKEIRVDVGRWKKSVRYKPDIHGALPLGRFIEKEIDRAGHEFINAIIHTKHNAAIADRWSRNKRFYPYFTEFVSSMLYMIHYSMSKPNAPIDLNAQADLNIMSHLLYADVLVSNEKGFLRMAFVDLWKPRHKVLMTGPEFVDYLGSF